MRGRNNNRKGPNPLTRNYESNGPDVKIRGSAQQVADKYAALARDAQSAGDRVMAENYLQHAEHYNRIIAAATAQAQAQRESREERDDRDNRDDRDDREDDGNDYKERSRQSREAAPRSEPAPANDGSGPQPVIEGTPAEVALGEQQSQPEKKRGRGRRAPNGGDESKQETAAGSDSKNDESAPAAKKPVRRTRRTATPAKNGDGEGSQGGEETGGNPLTAAAGE